MSIIGHAILENGWPWLHKKRDFNNFYENIFEIRSASRNKICFKFICVNGHSCNGRLAREFDSRSFMFGIVWRRKFGHWSNNRQFCCTYYSLSKVVLIYSYIYIYIYLRKYEVVPKMTAQIKWLIPAKIKSLSIATKYFDVCSQFEKSATLRVLERHRHTRFGNKYTFVFRV